MFSTETKEDLEEGVRSKRIKIPNLCHVADEASSSDSSEDDESTQYEAEVCTYSVCFMSVHVCFTNVSHAGHMGSNTNIYLQTRSGLVILLSKGKKGRCHCICQYMGDALFSFGWQN